MKFLLLTVYKLLSLFSVASGRAGYFAGRARALTLKPLFKKMGSRVIIGPHCNFVYPHLIELENDTSIGGYSHISGPLKINHQTMIAPWCLILTENHRYDDLDVPIGKQGNKPLKKVTIGSNCWIGARVILLPGVKIARGCIVGAGAVVRRNTPENSVLIGNPAVVIKKRGSHKKVSES